MLITNEKIGINDPEFQLKRLLFSESNNYLYCNAASSFYCNFANFAFKEIFLKYNP